MNDPSDKSVAFLTRNHLWQGLVLRARSPEKFNHALQCRSDKLRNNTFTRTIVVGNTSFHERVILYPKQKIRTETINGFDQINAQSSTLIEEPEKESLFVHFSYKRELDLDDKQVNIAEHLKAAYVQLDRDAITLIRNLADSEFN